eukprot:CAMPEP_0172763304 /NCGR_PEP_ID=MMETSP1074-20121228/175063_1 /TAXON_ID=2916 /ORGANISM="Ceratium fusus, Strain PA161109" /LENGTH=345 /DNA_ID=CAMNT_0013597857 /DNA_START=44 /DNA_END=1078 /DNA_ORIENTATION=+
MPGERDHYCSVHMVRGLWGAVASAGGATRLPGRTLGVQAAPGVRCDRTTSYRELRDMYAKRRLELGGPRLEWLARLLSEEECDAQALRRWVNLGRGAEKNAGSAEACSWCNVRITQSRVGSSAAAAAADAGWRPAKFCEICLRWHCVACCSQQVSIESLATPSSASNPSAKGRKRSTTMLQCCNSCSRFVDTARCRRDPRAVELPESSAKLFQAHSELAAAITSMATAIAQLEGLLRLPADVGPALADEWADALAASRVAATSARDRVERQVRAIGEISFTQASSRDVKVQEALQQHGRRMLEDLKPRLHAALARQGTPEGLKAAKGVAEVPGAQHQVAGPMLTR